MTRWAVVERWPPLAWGLLATGWLGAIAVVHPVGDFPLNDDWAYGRVVQSLLVLGHLQFPGEVAVSLVAQSAWGWLFTSIFGFSFTVLRASTLVAGLAGMVFSFELCRALGVRPAMRWLGTLCVGFTPLYFSLSHTFMTDVFFLAVCMGAILCFVRYLQSKQESRFWLAIGFSLLAALTRDVGILVPAAFWLTTLRRGGDALGPWSWRAWLPLVTCTLALVSYQQWLLATDRMPFAYGIHVFRLQQLGVGAVALNVVTSARAQVSYLGLLLFPVLLPLAAGRYAAATPATRVRALVVAVLTVGPLVAWSVVERSVLPQFIGNMLNVATIGPVVLPFAASVIGPPNGLFWIPVTIVALSGAGLLVVLLSNVFPVALRLSPARRLVGVIAMLYAIGLLFTVGHDRYFLLLLPLTVVLVASVDVTLPRWTFAPAFLLLASMVGIGIVGTHDYLAWNRGRWLLARDLLTREPAHRIDGGLEFDAWHAYPLERPFISDRSWWWVAVKPYVMALGERRRFQYITRVPVETWLPFGDGHVYLLLRE